MQVRRILRQRSFKRVVVTAFCPQDEMRHGCHLERPLGSDDTVHFYSAVEIGDPNLGHLLVRPSFHPDLAHLFIICHVHAQDQREWPRILKRSRNREEPITLEENALQKEYTISRLVRFVREADAMALAERLAEGYDCNFPVNDLPLGFVRFVHRQMLAYVESLDDEDKMSLKYSDEEFYQLKRIAEGKT